MNRGSRRLLLKTLKWVLVPLALILVGYQFVGPYVSDWANRSKVTEKIAGSQPQQ